MPIRAVGKPPIEEGMESPVGKSLWARWFEELLNTVGHHAGDGTTANRPTKKLGIGTSYFDTTLGYIIWYNGSAWVDASGTPV